MSAGGKTEPTYLALGSNIRPERHLRLAATRLRALFPEVRFSAVWLSPAVGTPGPDFLNAAACLRSELTATGMKFRVLRPLEAELGRVRNEDRNAPRVIDLDILLHANHVLDTEIWQQAHLAVPLAELLPDLPAPDGTPLYALAERLRAQQSIQLTDLKL